MDNLRLSSATWTSINAGNVEEYYGSHNYFYRKSPRSAHVELSSTSGPSSVHHSMSSRRGGLNDLRLEVQHAKLPSTKARRRRPQRRARRRQRRRRQRQLQQEDRLEEGLQANSKQRAPRPRLRRKADNGRMWKWIIDGRDSSWSIWDLLLSMTEDWHRASSSHS